MNVMLKIKWATVAGYGPTAWDRDNTVLEMHTPHHHEDRKEHKVVEADQTEKRNVKRS